MIKKLALVAVLIILAIPIILFIDEMHKRQVIIDQAKSYAMSIPQYPGANFSQVPRGWYSLGYMESSTTNDDWKKILDFYKGNIKSPWVYKQDTGTAGDRGIKYETGDYIMVINVTSQTNFIEESKPPYQLSIDVYQKQ